MRRPSAGESEFPCTTIAHVPLAASPDGVPSHAGYSPNGPGTVTALQTQLGRHRVARVGAHVQLRGRRPAAEDLPTSAGAAGAPRRPPATPLSITASSRP